MSFEEFVQDVASKIGFRPTQLQGISNIARPMDNALFMGSPNLQNSDESKPFAFCSKISVSPFTHLFFCLNFGTNPKSLAEAVKNLGSGVNNSKVVLDDKGLFLSTRAVNNNGVLVFDDTKDIRIKAEALYYFAQGYDKSLSEIIGWVKEHFDGVLESLSTSASLLNEARTFFVNPLNQILYGPPGTGKTYNSIYHALAIIKNVSVTDLLDDEKDNPSLKEFHKKEFDTLVESGKIRFVTFHQSYAYEEFVEGIKPVVNDTGEIEYKIIDGIFKRICLDAQRSDNTEQNFVLIIDEINRGNISKIFGELITLIEDSKRVGAADQILLKLAYSGTEVDSPLFGVPQNVFIVGTMNSTDRSIALIDTALRRRFTFIEYTSDESLLPIDVEGINIQILLKTINSRIEYLLDRDHLIGHAYLLQVKSKNDLASTFRNKIIPLLQEYFYNDLEKVQLVLGDQREWKKPDELKLIIEKAEIKAKKIFGSEIDGYEEKTIYTVRRDLEEERYESINPAVFTSIYNSSF